MTCLPKGQAGIQAFLSPGNELLYGLSFGLKVNNSQEATLLALNLIILSFSRIARNQLLWKNLNFVFVKQNLNLQLEKEKKLDGVM